VHFFYIKGRQEVQKTLHALIELQVLDNRLDELLEERGDLPSIVNDFEEKLKIQKTSLEEIEEEIKTSKLRIKEIDLFEKESKDKLDKYNEQLYQVKTNREYDAITVEIESVQQTQKEYESELVSLKSSNEEKEETITQLEAEVAKISEELSENKIELDSSLEETAGEESSLNKKRDKILKNLSKNVYKTYEKIRKARNGKGIANVENGTCGGCFSYIPPQKVVEVRKMKKIYECEFCGRILVWNE
jgi:predicted  nucleic acid-binding Zn-ribbon protein